MRQHVRAAEDREDERFFHRCQIAHQSDLRVRQVDRALVSGDANESIDDQRIAGLGELANEVELRRRALIINLHRHRTRKTLRQFGSG